jgi:hypothetical protein
MKQTGPKNAQQQLQQEFWNLMRKMFAEAGTDLVLGDTDYGDWMHCQTAVPLNRIRVHLYPLKRKFSVMAYLDGRKANPEYSDQWFRHMLANRAEIEDAVGAQLVWDRKPANVEVMIFREFEWGPFSDRKKWPDLIGVMRNQFEVFKSAFEPRMCAFAETHGYLQDDGSVIRAC